MAVLGAAGFAERERLMALLPAPDTPDETATVAERPAQPVRVTEVAYSAVKATESFTGTIRPHHEAALGFRLPGKLVARLVEVGDRVLPGQLVARLDDTDARLQLDLARAEETAALTDLDRAKAEVQRSQTLFAAGHIAKAALDRATSAVAEAVSRADRAARSRALAENQLSYADLVADAEGVVTATFAEAGQVVAAGQPVLAVARLDALDVVFALPEQARNLLDRAVASADLWGVAGKTYRLKLRDISPDVDPVGRTYRVRMALVAPDGEAALGRTVTVRLVTAADTTAAALPLAAVIDTGDGVAVWRLSKGGDRVERVPVDLDSLDGRVAMVRGGLVDGDIVISLGAHKIDPARPVRVVEVTAPPEG